jgi:hypothetical protein
VYRDGALVTSYTTTVDRAIGEASALIIGNIGELEFLAATPSVPPAPYKGMLDELRIYNYALTDAEITALYNAGATTLPLNLVDFSVARQGSKAMLTWKTSEEVNTKDFEIQRSYDGVNFHPLGSVTAKGAANNSYSFIDNAPLKGLVYYRIKMNDKDGQFKFTPVKSVLFSEANKVSVYPNPANKQTILYFGSLAKAGELLVTDISGKLVHRNIIAKQANSYTLETSRLPVGTYTINLIANDAVQTVKLVVAH